MARDCALRELLGETSMCKHKHLDPTCNDCWRWDEAREAALFRTCCGLLYAGALLMAGVMPW